MAEPNLAALLEAVEQAWEHNQHHGPREDDFYTERAVFHRLDDLVATLRATRADSFVPVLLSRESIEALRQAMDSDATDPECPLWLDRAATACVLLADSCGVPDHPGRSKKRWVETHCAHNDGGTVAVRMSDRDRDTLEDAYQHLPQEFAAVRMRLRTIINRLEEAVGDGEK